jgi:hypothetical protein
VSRRLRSVLRDERATQDLRGPGRSSRRQVAELKRAATQTASRRERRAVRGALGGPLAAGDGAGPGTQQAFGVRNVLVHTGDLRDVDAAAAAGDRIHALAERLAYRLLQGEDTWLDHFAYYHVYAISGDYPRCPPRLRRTRTAMRRRTPHRHRDPPQPSRRTPPTRPARCSDVVPPPRARRRATASVRATSAATASLTRIDGSRRGRVGRLGVRVPGPRGGAPYRPA